MNPDGNIIGACDNIGESSASISIVAQRDLNRGLPVGAREFFAYAAAGGKLPARIFPDGFRLVARSIRFQGGAADR